MKIVVLGGKSIVTKYAGATNTRGAAIVASVLDGGKPMLTARVPYPHELDEYGAHAAGARAALEKWKRNGLNANASALAAGLIGVGTATGYAFGFAAFAHEFDEHGNVGAYRRNPAKRGGKRIARAGVSRRSYLARPSQITRKRPTKRLASRRRRNLAQGRAGFFPNPTVSRARASAFRPYAKVDTRGGGFEYGMDAVTPVAWILGRARELPKGLYVWWLNDVPSVHEYVRTHKRVVMSKRELIAELLALSQEPFPAKIQRNPARKRARNLPGATGCTYVQVRRGAAWISVACSKRTGELGRAEAVKWAKDYASKHPGRKVRVFWKGGK